jgi:hypothetical protein
LFVANADRDGKRFNLLESQSDDWLHGGVKLATHSLKITLALVRFDHIASDIVNANHSIV